VSSIAVPTLVIHGTADPMFPIAHGEALAEEIPGARMITIEGMGHGFVKEDWEEISAAIVEHTG
jgi:pimeloyl-ACP methyl ester carboxylesterase